MSAVELERRGRIALILVDHPPVNAISQAVRAGIIETVRQADTDDDIDAIVLGARGRTFMAGADITEFGGPPKEPGFPEVIAALEGAAKPVVAAIHGTAYGGGLELALACHYRVAQEDARLGLPEVNLGIIPGAQGTQRLPRLAGVALALEMIVTGAPIDADTAFKAGILDEIVIGDRIDGAVAYAQKLADAGAPQRRISNVEVPREGLDDQVFDEFRKAMAKKARGLFAPEQAIKAVEAAVALPFEEGVRRERELITECMRHPQSKALQHAFFAERQTARVPDLPKDLDRRDIARIGIVGGGTMGSGIALACANAGLAVNLVEQDEEGAERAMATVTRILDGMARKGRIAEAERDSRASRITVSSAMEDLGHADLLIEAVFENLDVKKDVFRTLDAVAKPGAILATNTSYLDIDAIAAVTDRPADVVGLHFFSPANIMKLLEIVRAEKTAAHVLATALAFAKSIGKVPVVARVCHGFIGNRMLEGYVREAGLLLLETGDPEPIDKAVYEFGYPMGPLQMGDLAGLDIGYMLRQAAPADRYDPNAYRVMDRLVEMGRKGQKTGGGIYDYEDGARTQSAKTLTIAKEEAAAAHIARRDMPAQEIVERCVLPLINEGAKLLEEGIAIRASDIDVTYLYGYGFPRWRGGPMFYADGLGLDHVLARIEHYRGRLGERWWTPAPLIEKLASEGKSFKQYDKDRGVR